MEEDNEFGRGHSLFLEGALLIFGGSGPYFWNNCSDSAEVVSLDWATENPTKSSSITWQTAIKQKQKKVNGSRQPSTPQSLTHEHPFLSLPQTYWESTKSNSIASQTAIKQKQKKVNGSRQPSTPQSLTHEHPFLSLPQTYCWAQILNVEPATVLFDDRFWHTFSHETHTSETYFQASIGHVLMFCDAGSDTVSEM